MAKNLSNLGGLAEKLGGENIIESLKEAIQKKDYQTVENTARSLGDAASEVGLDDLSKLSGEVVSAVKASRPWRRCCWTVWRRAGNGKGHA